MKGAATNEEVERGWEWTVRDEKRVKVAVPTADGETVELLSAVGSSPFSTRNNRVITVARVALQPAACLCVCGLVLMVLTSRLHNQVYARTLE